MPAMSDETPVERRLRDIVNAMADSRSPHGRHQAEAIDCGREAIRLLREMMAESGDPFKWEGDARALLARCTEGPR